MDFEMQLSMAGIHPDFAQEKRLSHKAVGVSRKDTIIIAMLVNIALLAVLFATASRQPSLVSDTKVEPIVAQFETVSHVTSPVQTAPVVKTKEPVDEIDEILKSYALQNAKTSQIVVKPVQEVVKETIATPVSSEKSSYIEVKVKKGDVLSRIARQHNVKVEDIIVLNGLESAHVKVGQVLKIPSTTSAKTAPAKAASSPAAPEYYVVKTGDSPWKIAKKCRIDVEDLLRLNNLDEDKAKNLKIGQKLRIR